MEDNYNDDATSQVETSYNANSELEVEADDRERPPAAKKEKENNLTNGSKRASSSIKKYILEVIEQIEQQRSRQEMENSLTKCKQKEWQ